MRLLICAGGTGGGVYPALAVLSALGNDVSATLWVGGEGGMEADLVQRAGIPFTTIPAAGVHGVGLLRLPSNLWRLSRGYLASRRIIHEFKPDVLFFTGGYLAVPVALAGRKLPILLYVPDIEPGMALKFLERYADCITITAGDSRQFFKPKSRLEITGYPTRPELGKWDRSEALKHFGLQSNLPTLFFFGGSRGARAINQAVVANLPALLANAQIIHISGDNEWLQAKSAHENLPSGIANRYHPFPYLHEDMGAAFTCADLVISRAGASTLGELPLFGVPAILVPNVYFWRYQKTNAEYLARQGAAVILPEEDLPARLVSAVQELLANPGKLEDLRQAMQSAALPNPARRIGDLLCELAGRHKAGKEESSC